jgi:hypothetical protein
MVGRALSKDMETWNDIKQIMIEKGIDDLLVVQNDLLGRIELFRNRDIVPVLNAFTRFFVTDAERPAGSSEEVVMFLVNSAIQPGLWKRMAEEDPRLGNVLLGYYGRGLSMAKLAGEMEIKYPAQVGRLIARGLKWLWDEMPEEEVDELVAMGITLEKLEGTRLERTRAQSKEWAREHRFHERGREFALRRWGSREGESGEQGENLEQGDRHNA